MKEVILMMSVTEYAKDVSVSVSHILKLCDNVKKR